MPRKVFDSGHPTIGHLALSGAETGIGRFKAIFAEAAKSSDKENALAPWRLRALFHLPSRGTQRFLRSISKLADDNLS